MRVYSGGGGEMEMVDIEKIEKELEEGLEKLSKEIVENNDKVNIELIKKGGFPPQRNYIISVKFEGKWIKKELWSNIKVDFSKDTAIITIGKDKKIISVKELVDYLRELIEEFIKTNEHKDAILIKVEEKTRKILEMLKIKCKSLDCFERDMLTYGASVELEESTLTLYYDYQLQLAGIEYSNYGNPEDVLNVLKILAQHIA